jgi:EAL domain-containing protein (putative c-di-GMP-specific phosphodiesterase class I)
VKLARELVATVPGEARSCKVVEGLLALLESLDIRVVVNGVETEEQARWLRQWPRVLAQGARWPRPVRALSELMSPASSL